MDENIDALDLIRAQNDHVRALLSELEGAPDNRCERILEELFLELRIQAALNSEIFLPAARQVLPDEPLLENAEEEDGRLLGIIEQLQTILPSSEGFRRRLETLHHMISDDLDRIEDQLLPKLRERTLGADIGVAMQERRQELEQEKDTNGHYAGASHGIDLRKENQ